MIVLDKIPYESKITLCGSSKFKSMFDYINKVFSLQGKIIYSLAFFDQADGLEVTGQEKTILANVQKIKILNSDCIFVIDVDGYIDELTKSEINFAEILCKPIYYLTEYLS